MCKVFSVAYAIVSKFEFIMANIMILGLWVQINGEIQRDKCVFNLFIT